MPPRKAASGPTKRQAAVTKAAPKRKAASGGDTVIPPATTTTTTTTKFRTRTNKSPHPAPDEADKPPSRPTKRARTAKDQPKPKPKPATTKRAPVSVPRATPSSAKLNARPARTLDVYVFGDGSFGELGLGHKTATATRRDRSGGEEKTAKLRPCDVRRPRLNPVLSSAGTVQVACGGMHAAALTREGRVLTWGVNDEKALGRETGGWEGGGDEEDEDDEEGLDPYEAMPGEVQGLGEVMEEGEEVVAVAAASSATFVLTDRGGVYGWGTFRASDGVFGFSPTSRIQATPARVPGLSRITALAAGANHMLALDAAGRVLTWGANDQLQLGRRGRRRETLLVPRACGRAQRAVAVFAGAYHSFYVDDAGRLWGWGLNNFSQTGHVEEVGVDMAIVQSPKVVEKLRGRRVERVAAGQHHLVVMVEGGETLVWGRVDGHRLGVRPEVLDEENTVFDEHGKPRILVEPTALPGLRSSFITSCSDTTIAVTPEGEAYSWGFSENLQTGQGTQDDVEIPTKIEAPDLVGKKLVWAGLGGQYGMLASVREE
ncbi:regulator of chromosome condensation 1/beta-lactamase-inhibitor protein II [Camillea tinctor]|nr:regulator of chromosome condensation 1/beta-lactamase-inhibitor protein II [Camillea tinctor]